MTIVFTVEFNVEQQTSTAYKQFIESLRPRLAASYSHGLPVLPIEEKPPTHWFDLILRTKDRAITFRIQRSNLYLLGYRMGTTAGTWWEFNSKDSKPPRPPSHLFPTTDGQESSFLGFESDYGSLANAAGVRVDTIKLGQQPIIGAVNALANTTTVGATKARSLIIVIRMICESIRYARISNHIATNYTAGTKQEGFDPPAWMSTLEKNWGQLSFDLLAKDANPEYKFRPVSINATEINTVEQAVAILGVLKRGSDTILFRQPQGQPMVEVFSVRINGDNPASLSLYGTITVTDGLGSQYIYNRQKGDDDSKSIGDNNIVFLTGPARSISACDSFTINLALIDKNTDHEVSQGQISWNVYDTTNEYDKLLSQDVHGEYGSVTVNYVVLSNAVEATVEVVMLENEAAANGRLTISNGVSESIRLSRSVVAVPLNSALSISYHDDDIAKTTARFPVQLAGTSKKTISGKHCEINVKFNSNN